MQRFTIRRGAALAALAGTLVLVPSAGAATYNVGKTADDIPADPADCTPNAASNPNCSLREAIAAANENGSDDLVNVPAGTYLLVNDQTDPDGDADLDILTENSSQAFAGNLTIQGAGAAVTVIRSNNLVGDTLINSRIFDIEGGGTTGGCINIPGASVNMNDLTVTRGSGSSDGGGIHLDDGGSDCNGDDTAATDTSLTLRRSQVLTNTGDGEGGGIYSGGELLLVESTVAGNSTVDGGDGGGIMSRDSLTLVNSTVSGNHSDDDAAGIFARANDIEQTGSGGDENQGTLVSTNSTIVLNEADDDGGGIIAQGPFNGNGSDVTLRNTIVALNSSAEDENQNCVHPVQFTSLGGNIDNGSGCGFYSANDQSGTDPRIGPLRNNGGPTLTHSLIAGSPAIDGAADFGCPATDQRGTARPQGPKCDSGAFEAAAPAPAPAADGGSNLVNARCANEFRGTNEEDLVNGSVFGDAINGLDGDDVINGLQGDDCISGDRGDDVLTGSEGKDVLTGDEGEDILTGGVDDDRLHGGDDNDKLNGGSGDDLLSGGRGRDKLSGGNGNDRLIGGAGNDTIDGGQGDNTISAGAGNDIVNSANGERETINCGSGRRDVARADRSDTVSNCERVLRLRSSRRTQR